MTIIITDCENGGTDILRHLLGIGELQKGQKEIMATAQEILAEQAKTKADLATLQATTQSLLTAFAAGTLSPADAQSILDNATADDATATSLNSSIAAALGNAAPPPAGGAPTS